MSLWDRYRRDRGRLDFDLSFVRYESHDINDAPKMESGDHKRDFQLQSISSSIFVSSRLKGDKELNTKLDIRRIGRCADKS